MQSPFGHEYNYLQPGDRKLYNAFCLQQLAKIARQPPKELWHYTSAEGLIGILSTGRIHCTHVACLNDSMEQRYFGDLLYQAMATFVDEITEESVSILWKLIDYAYQNREMEKTPHFVACLTEAADDLGQWRGYGGGECGYALVFNSNDLIGAIHPNRNALLLPMCYPDESHHIFLDGIIKGGIRFFLAGIEKGYTDFEKWASDFMIEFAWQLDVFASITKHSKFKSEAEQRIVVHLKDEHRSALEFRQKRTLLARYLPFDLRREVDGTPKLPLSRIMVGPNPAPKVTVVAVADLLRKYGLEHVPVDISEVPYRVA